MRCVWARAVCWGLALAALQVCAAAPGSAAPTVAQPGPAGRAPAVGAPAPAVWREQRVNFFYMGRTARYSCDGLRDKVRAMLIDLGARRDVKITALGCEDYTQLRGHSVAPSLSVVFSAPALPDAGLQPLRPGDLGLIDARFEAFTITGDTFRNMGIGDCELVEEFTRQILPKLVTRAVKRDIACVPDRRSGGRFLVRGDILKAVRER